MATVTGYTAARMKEIEDTTVIDGDVIGDDLILLQRDGTQINAGNVRGAQGIQGDPGPAFDLGGYVEPLNDRGNVSGAITLDFATHNIWRLNPTAAIQIAFANQPAAGFLASGTILVANSTYAITWPVGTLFPGGEPPILDGETWLSVIADSVNIRVGTSWVGMAT